MKDLFHALLNASVFEVFVFFAVTSVFIYFLAVIYISTMQARELKRFSGEYFSPKKKKKK